MFLKSLIIRSGETIIRSIGFKTGLNLIVDETKTGSLQESGNNVGKTTVLRLIDFCLGADGKNVYSDTEFKGQSNTNVESFLKEEDVSVLLVLVRSFDSDEEVQIERNFKSYSQKVLKINGIDCATTQFGTKLKEIFFGSDDPKPTFRQIISKNIRYERSKLDNTIKVLHPTTTRDEYEALYFFWLGIETDEARRKQKLRVALNVEEGLMSRLKRTSSLSQITQTLAVLERDIEVLEIEQERFSVNASYEADLKNLNKINSEINAIQAKISRYSVRRDVIIESEIELKKEYSTVNTAVLQGIYNSAKKYINDLHSDFAKLVEFHNSMVAEKIRFILDELPSINSEIETLGVHLREKLTQEKLLSERIKKAGAIEDLRRVVEALNKKFEMKGVYLEKLQQWETSSRKIDSLKLELIEINKGLSSKEEQIENRIKIFNSFFTEISKELYGEQFVLSQVSDERGYELKIAPIGGNLGTGKKKGQIAAFDIAYVMFCEDLGLPCAHFILHDQLETVHHNQLILLAKLVEKTGVQFVLPVLRDKMPNDIDIDSKVILSLSQSDKLFKIP